MKSILTAAVLSLAASAAAAGPAVVTGVTPTAGAYEALSYETREMSPIQWIVAGAPARKTVRAAEVHPVAAPLATAGAAQDVASAAALMIPVAMR